jgi:hypothetical protein
MSRLVILLGPVAAALGGVALGFAWDYLIVDALLSFVSDAKPDEAKEEKPANGKGKGEKVPDGDRTSL